VSGPQKTDQKAARLAKGGKGKRARQRSRFDWRDHTLWIAVVLLLAVGFGAAYGIWYRTWQIDIAREQDWYVATCLLRLRDFRARTEAFFLQQNTSSLALLATSASRLDGALAQIPRRGPVQWRAEIVGLGETLRSYFDAAMLRELTAPDPQEIAALAEHLPELRDLMEQLEQALSDTVVRVDNAARRLKPDFETELLQVIQTTRDFITALPR